jgi:manganese/iron transport system permease protein
LSHNPAGAVAAPQSSASGLEEFDALLEGAGAAPPAPSVSLASPPELAAASVAQSPISDFVQGWPLYQDPILCAVLAGATLGALGVFVVLRRAVFVTAVISQAAGLGVALAFYVQIHHGLDLPPVLGALVLGVAATWLVGVRTPSRVARETMVGFAFVSASALAVLVGDRIAQEAHDIAAVLFGTAVLVRPLDLLLVAGAAVLTLILLGLFGRLLIFTGFDPEGARVHGLPVHAVEAGFWALFALTVSVATRALGALPVFALAVMPAAAGLAVARRLRTAMLIAIVGGALAGVVGYLVAFFAALPVGASQSTCAAALALAVYLVGRLFKR